MHLSSFQAAATGETREPCGRIGRLVVMCAMVTGMAVAGLAQMSQPPSRPPKPVVSPEANRPPDANDQMIMREKNAQRRNFDAANAERLREVEQVAQMLETMAIALKAEVDKSEEVSQNTIRKAETIEKLAHIVKERMTLTVAPN